MGNSKKWVSHMQFGNTREHEQEVACVLFMSHGGFQYLIFTLVILDQRFPFVKFCSKVLGFYFQF